MPGKDSPQPLPGIHHFYHEMKFCSLSMVVENLYLLMYILAYYLHSCWRVDLSNPLRSISIASFLDRQFYYSSYLCLPDP